MKSNIASLIVLVLFIDLTCLAQAPTIASFAPTSGPVGTEVTVTGTNFNAAPANNIVFFGATEATVTAASVTELTVNVPVGATYMPITVLVNELIAYSSAPFVVTFGGQGIDANSFDPKIDVSTGSNPISISLGDLDGDGKSDLIVSNFGADVVSIYRNTSSSGTISSGSFAAAHNLTTGTDPLLLATGDLDGDGKLDLAVANFTSNTVSLFRNTSSPGTISYASRIDLATGVGPTSVAIGDLDGDGKADLAVTNQTTGTVSVYHNTSSGTGTIGFATKDDFITGTEPNGVGFGDLDGDGKVDIALVNQGSNSISVFRNTATVGDINGGSFNAKFDYATAGVPYKVTIGDLDGDDKPELIVPNFGAATISILRNTSTEGIFNSGSFALKEDFTVGGLPQSVEIGDLDGDGKVDLAVANRSSSSTSISILRNKSSSGVINANSFESNVDFVTGTMGVEPVSVTIGDIDGDGKSDIAVANVQGSSVSVFRNAVIPLSIETDITAFSFTEQTGAATIDAVNHTVDIEVAYQTDVTALVSTFALSTGANAKVGATTQTSTTTSNNFASSVTYSITAEDGVTLQDWTVTVTEGPSNQTDFTAFSFASQADVATINASNHTIDISVDFGTSLTDLVADFTLSTGATATVGAIPQTSMTTINDFSNPVTYKVTAEDGVANQDWIVTITVALNTTTNILTYAIPNQVGSTTIDTGNSAVSLVMPIGTDLRSLIGAYTLSEGATAKVGSVTQMSGSTPNDFTNVVTYVLTAQDGISTENWVINVSVAPSILGITNESFVSSYDQGGTMTASITVNDANNVESVNFVSRGISEELSEATAEEVVASGNVYEITVKSTELIDPIGLTYYFEVNDKQTPTGTINSSTGNAYVKTTSIPALPSLSFGDQVSDYQIIAIPFVLDDQKVTSVFSELGQYDKTLWRLFDYANQANREYSAFSNIEIGKGYWFIARNSTTIGPGSGSTPQVTEANPFSMSLASGWNLIGNPYNFRISWDEILTANGSPSGIGRLNTFSGGTLSESATLDKYRGGFVFNSGSATTINIPVTRNTSLGGRHYEEEKPSDLNEKYWELALNLSQGELQNRLGGIGMHPDATMLGKDEFDQVSIPLIDGMGFFELGFAHPEYSAQFSKEVIPTSDKYVWDFEIYRDNDEPLNLSWNNESFGDNDKQLYLFNPTTSEVIDMQIENNYQISTVTNTLKVLFGNIDYVNQQLDQTIPIIGEPYPNPTNYQMSQSFKISNKDGQTVSFKVYDSAGKIIANTIKEYQQGYHQLEWQFEYPGMYVVQLQLGETLKTHKVIVR